MPEFASGGGDVPSPRGGVLSPGECLLPGGSSALGGSAPGGVCSRGVSDPGGCLTGGCLTQGVSASATPPL